MHLSVPGAQLFVVEQGSGAPRVMLHGGPGASHDYLRPQLDAVPGRLVYYDQRGGGQSALSPGGEPGGWRAHVADLDAVRAHLGLSRLTLVGYSWGGLLAMLYALEHADRVERMVLLSPAPASSAERPEIARRLAARAARPEVAQLRASLDTRDRRHRFALAVAGYFVDPRRALEMTPFLVQQRAEQAVWRSLGDYDLRPRLETLRVASLVVHGEGDPIPIEGAQATAESLGAEWLPLANCGHVPYIEAADRLFPALAGFLDGR